MNNSFYRTVWRWHFFAGLVFAPVLIALAITGAIYLFKPWVEPLMHANLYYVEQGTVQKDPQTLLDAAKTYNVNARVTNYTAPQDENRAAQFAIETTGVSSDSDTVNGTVFVNPYNAEVLGFLPSTGRFMDVILLLHGELMIGTIGDRIVELAACWGVILLVTGLYLYWPSIISVGTLFKRPTPGVGRNWWKNTHALVGVWGSLGILMLILTGLPWAGVMGEQINRIATSTHTGYPDNLWGNVPTSVVPTKEIAKTAWAAEQLPVPKSQSTISSAVGLNDIDALVRSEKMAKGYTITLPASQDGVYTAAVFPRDVTAQATLHIDQYSGAVLADLRYADYGPLAKIIETGIALHEGRLLGPVNLVVCFLLCIALVFITVSGAVMWWKRRPNGKSGIPRKLE
ncbi:MAG: PepSY-associated TM helix domain-containing protein, partial [Bacilli bacterium]